MDEKEIRAILVEVKHPAINASLIELGIVKDISVTGNKVELTIAFPFPNIPIADQLISSVKTPLQERGLDVTIKTTIMDDEARNRFLSVEQTKWKGL